MRTSCMLFSSTYPQASLVFVYHLPKFLLIIAISECKIKALKISYFKT